MSMTTKALWINCAGGCTVNSKFTTPLVFKLPTVATAAAAAATN